MRSNLSLPMNSYTTTGERPPVASQQARTDLRALVKHIAYKKLRELPASCFHGSVLDELRRRDWAPRSLRRFEREHVKNLTLREIGEVLGVSESRVSQIHAQLKTRIRDRLTRHEPLFSAVVIRTLVGPGGGVPFNGHAQGGRSVGRRWGRHSRRGAGDLRQDGNRPPAR